MKTKKLIKRVFALPCGEYTAPAFLMELCPGKDLSARDRCVIGKKLSRLRNCVLNGKVLFIKGSGLRRIYRLEDAWAAAQRESRKRFHEVAMATACRMVATPAVPENPFARRGGETVVDYMARVRPLLAPEQLDRPTREGHERLCIAHGWDGFDRPPLSWPLYSAIAEWKPEKEGGAA